MLPSEAAAAVALAAVKAAGAVCTAVCILECSCCSAFYGVALSGMLLSKLQSRVYSRGSAMMHHSLHMNVERELAMHSLRLDLR
jgi:hypothetical protein